MSAGGGFVTDGSCVIEGAVADACSVDTDVVAITGGGLPVDAGRVAIEIGEGASNARGIFGETSETGFRCSLESG